MGSPYSPATDRQAYRTLCQHKTDPGSPSPQWGSTDPQGWTGDAVLAPVKGRKVLRCLHCPQAGPWLTWDAFLEHWRTHGKRYDPAIGFDCRWVAAEESETR